MNIKTWVTAISLACVTLIATSTAHASSRISSVNRVPLTIHVSHLTLAQQQELRCHSLNIYHEARGTPVHNQVGVAWVVRNRQARTGQSACEVIFARHQFSWTSRKWHIIREMDAWRRSQELALLIMEDQIWDPTGGATHFHEHQIRPSWSRRASHTVRIGAHTFHRIELAQAP